MPTTPIAPTTKLARTGSAPRLFVHPERLPAQGELILDGPTQHYLGRVLRLGPGDAVVLLDGRGRVCAATVIRFEAAQVVLRLDAADAAPDRDERPSLPGPQLVLLCGLLKGEKQDFVVQKATELGAAVIVPVACQRSVPQLGEERGEKRQQRWQRIALAAAQQCRRLDIPTVTPPASWGDAMAGRAGVPPADKGSTLRLLLYEGAAPPLGTVLERLPGAASDAPPGTAPAAAPVIELLIGPEGGFTAVEVQSALAAGFVPTSLGPLTLRAETAAVVALGVVQYALSTRAAAATTGGDSP